VISQQLLITGDGFGQMTIPLLCAGMLIPYAVGLNDPPKPLRLDEKIRLSPRDKLKELRIHYWIGYMAVAATLVHAGIPIVSGVFGMMNNRGLWFGVLSAVFLVLQLPLGILLRNVTLLKRRRWRRLHFWLAISCAATLFMHVYYCWGDFHHIVVTSHLA
jgi:hypothetical protein